MARTMLKPDSTRYPPIVQTRSIGPEWIEPDSAEPWAESGDVVAFPSKADLPTDLALDLRLREILQQARLATAASGAVIALARGDKIVCRATLGDKAPSAGVSLNTRSGLSGACVQTREMQLCDDTLADPRVNVVACRDLGIRSIVVLPVLDGGELWGVLELFQPFPAPSANLTCRPCNYSVARFLPRCVKPSRTDPRRWRWKHSPSPRRLIPWSRSGSSPKPCPRPTCPRWTSRVPESLAGITAPARWRRRFLGWLCSSAGRWAEWGGAWQSIAPPTRFL